MGSDKGAPEEEHMRLIIVSREASRDGGLYFGRATTLRDQEERGKQVAELLWSSKDDESAFQRALNAFNTISTMTPLIGPIFRAFHSKASEARLKALLHVAYQTGIGDAQQAKFLMDVKGHLEPTFGHEILKASQSPWALQPFEEHCLTLTAHDLVRLGVGLKDVASLLVGAIATEAQYNSILQAEGGHSRIHVFNLDTARQVLRRHGGGIIEEGCYVLHPKRDGVLVPFKTYHMDMLQEMTREARVVMGRLGARRLEVVTDSGVSFNGTMVSNVPLKSGKAAVEVTDQKHKRVTFEWGSATFEPDAALKDCVWIQDNAGIMTIVDQRRTSNLTRYEEFSTIDTTFKLSIEVMKQFESTFSWAEKSTYRYEVEFFDRI